ncbi:MAG: hypothetical protein ACOYMN_17420, partial [Roseimicrobium sp.]
PHRVSRYVPGAIGALAIGLALAAWQWWPSREVETRFLQAYASGNTLPPAYCVSALLPKGLLINAVLCAGLALAWWLGRGAMAKRESQKEAHARTGHRVVWLMVLLVILLSGALNARRLSMSLWNDEVLTMRNVVVGKVKPDKKGHLRVFPTTWVDTAFNYWLPNNHVLFSLASRVTHEAWPAQRSATGPYFNEVGLRLPAYVAGLASLAVLAALCLKLGLRHVAILAVCLLALHPWFVRYTTEARGYAFVLLLAPTLLLCMVQATRTGAWSWWLAAGFTEFLLLYTLPTAVHIVLPAMASALLLMWAQWKTGRERLALVARMGGGSLLGAMLTVPLMLPLIPQLKAFIATGGAQWDWTAKWLWDATAEFFTGVYWDKIDVTNPHIQAWGQVAHHHPGLVGVGIGAFSIIFISGVIGLWKHSIETRCLLPALLLPAVELTVINAVTRTTHHGWYLIIGLPGLVLVMAAGIIWLARLVAPRCPVVERAALASSLAVALFAWVTNHQRNLLSTVSIDPRREAAALCNATFNPRDPRIDDVVIGGIGPAVYLDLAYLPAAVPLKSIEEIRERADLATRTKHPFYLCCGRFDLARDRYPEEFAFVEQSGLFEPVAKVQGVDEERTTMVYRYRKP